MAYGPSKRRSPDRRCKVDGCDRPNAIDGRCLDHDAQFRMQQRGTCKDCNRPVWSSGYCSTHYKARYDRKRQIRDNFRGNPDNRDDFVRLMESIVAHIKQRRMRYILWVMTGTGYDHPDVRDVDHQLGLLRSTLSIKQYNWVLRQVNEGLSEGNRIPMYYEESHVKEQSPQGAEDDAGTNGGRRAA